MTRLFLPYTEPGAAKERGEDPWSMQILPSVESLQGGGTESPTQRNLTQSRWLPRSESQGGAHRQLCRSGTASSQQRRTEACTGHRAQRRSIAALQPTNYHCLGSNASPLLCSLCCKWTETTAESTVGGGPPRASRRAALSSPTPVPALSFLFACPTACVRVRLVWCALEAAATQRE